MAAKDDGDNQYTYDLFLVHSSDDKDKARHIDDSLQADGFATYAHYRSDDVKDKEGFFIGKFVIDNVRYAIQNSRLVLILVTPSAVASGWVTFEMILSIERSLQQDEMCVRLMFQGMSDDEIKQFMTGDFEYIPYIVLDFNKESWKSDLKAKINEPNPKVHDVLPVGNVAHGLVFNYFTGFLKNVLPRLLETIQKTSYHKNNQMLQKFVVVIPNSCQVKPIEGEYGDVSITREKESLEISADRGDKFRPYNLSVYCITKGGKSVYFTAECPFIVATMSKIPKFVKLGPSFLKMQVERFRKTLMEMVNHRGNLTCNNTVCFVDFDDTSTKSTTTLGDNLWTAIAAQTLTEETKTKTVIKAGKLETDSGTDTDKQYFATITNDTNESDQITAKVISSFLEDKGVKFTNGIGAFNFDILDQAKWNVFVLSKDGNKSEKLVSQLHSALQKSVDNDVIQVIPIVSMGTDMKDIPDHLKWVTMIQADKDGSHLNHMWDIMQGKQRKMIECMPSGPVYQGLAYAYIVNYIAVGLVAKTKQGQGFRERFEDATKTFKLDCPCVPRVFLITAESCEFVPPGSPFQNERLIGDLEPAMLGPRKYDLKLYELTMKDGKKVCYAREYTTPAVSMHEMAHKYPFAGMDKENMKTQARKFVNLCSEIVKNKEFRTHIGDINDKCVLVYFNDAEEKMTDALERELQTFLHEGEYIPPP